MRRARDLARTGDNVRYAPLRRPAGAGREGPARGSGPVTPTAAEQSDVHPATPVAAGRVSCGAASPAHALPAELRALVGGGAGGLAQSASCEFDVLGPAGAAPAPAWPHSAGVSARVLAECTRALLSPLSAEEAGARGPADGEDALVAAFRLMSCALVDAPPALLSDGGFIAAGYCVELDAARASRDASGASVEATAEALSKATGIPSLRIRTGAAARAARACSRGARALLGAGPPSVMCACVPGRSGRRTRLYDRGPRAVSISCARSVGSRSYTQEFHSIPRPGTRGG